MAQGLMGLSNLLGQSSNASSGGLFGGGVFSQPESRGQRRSRLLTEAISGAGQNPYARLGASFGGLLGMGARAGAEGLGIVDAPAEVQQAEAIRQVQQEVAEQGLDPMANPREFGQYVSSRFQELNQPQLATRSLLQARQLESQFAPEQPELSNVRDIETEDGVKTVGTANNQLVEVTPQGIQPFRGERLAEEQDDINVTSQGRFRNRETGDTFTLVRTNKGLARQTVDSQGQPQFQFVDSSRFEPIQAAERGEPGGFDNEFNDLEVLRNTTVNFAREANNLADQITPETVGIPGGVSRGLESLKSQAVGAIRATTGLDFNAPEDVDAYSDTFENLGLADASSSVKSALVNAAISKAYVDQGGEGDIRKNEVERGLESIRAGSGDPGQIKAALGRLSRDFIARYNTALESATQRAGGAENVPFDPLDPANYGLTPESAGEGSAQGRLTVERVQNLSDQELRNLDPNSIPNDPEVLGALQDRLNNMGSNDRSNRSRGGGAQ